VYSGAYTTKLMDRKQKNKDVISNQLQELRGLPDIRKLMRFSREFFDILYH
jgi:hypothetical protein